MRAIIQRVSSAQVRVEGECIAAIEAGMVILLGIEQADGPADIEWMAGKVSRMRIFDDEQGKMNRSLLDQRNPQAMIISQFTLYAATRKGNRPSFIRAARPDHSEPIYEAFCAAIDKELGCKARRGRFGASMKVHLVNDGPVTIPIDSRNRE